MGRIVDGDRPASLRPAGRPSSSRRRLTRAAVGSKGHERARALKLATLVFLANKCLVVLVSAIATRDIWPARSFGSALHYLFIDNFRFFDAGMLASVATQGYREPKMTTYFPLYPVVEAGVSRGLHISVLAAGILISHVAFFLLLYFFIRLARIDYDWLRSRRAVLLLAFFPTAFYFSAAYTEATFMLVSVLALLSLRNKKWPAAGVFGGLAALTRNTGVLLGIPYLLEHWAARRAAAGRPEAGLKPSAGGEDRPAGIIQAEDAGGDNARLQAVVTTAGRQNMAERATAAAHAADAAEAVAIAAAYEVPAAATADGGAPRTGADAAGAPVDAPTPTVAASPAPPGEGTRAPAGRSWWPLVWVVVIGVGALVYVGYLWAAKGDPLAFAHQQKAYGRGTGTPWGTLWHGYVYGLKVIYHLHWPLDWTQVYYMTELFFPALVLVVLITSFRKLRWSYWSLLLYSLVMPLLAPANAEPGLSSRVIDYFVSFSRYSLVIVPLFFGMERLLRRRWVFWGYMAFSVLFLALFTYAWSRHRWVA